MSSSGNVKAGIELVAVDASKAIGELNKYGKSLQDLDKTGETVAKKLTTSYGNIEKGSAVLSKASGETKKYDSELKNVSTSASKLDQSAKANASSLGTLNTKIKETVTQQKGLATEIGKTATGAKQLDTATKGNATSLGTLNTKLKETVTTQKSLVTSTTQVADSTKKVDAETKKVGMTIQQYEAKLKTTVAGQKLLATQSTQLVTSIQKEGTAYKTTGDQVQQANQKIKQSQDQVVAGSNKLVTGLQKEKTEMQNLGRQSMTTSTELKKMVTETDKLAASQNRANASTGKLGTSMMTHLGSITALGGSLVSVWQSYDSLGDAQLKVDKATNALTNANIKYKALQNTVNKMIAEGKEGTVEYQIATEKLALQEEKLAAIQGTLTNAQEDLNITQANFYMQIIPQTVAMLGSMVAVLGVAGSKLNFFKKGVTDVGTETKKTGRILSLVGLTNPFFLALTIGGGLVAAFVTNLGGFRDAINGIGESLGNAAAPLKPFLTMIGDLGSGLVDLFGMGEESAKKTNKAVFDLGKELGNYSTQIKTTFNDIVYSLQQSDNSIVQTIGYTTAGVVTKMTEMGKGMESQLQMSTNTWNTFADQIAKRDWSGAFTTLKTAVGEIPGIIQEAVTDAGELWGEISKGAHALSIDVGKAMWALGGEVRKFAIEQLPVIVTEFQKWGGEIGNSIVESLPGIAEGIKTWVVDNIVTPINGYVELITAGDFNQLWTRLVSDASNAYNVITGWITTSIVEPINNWITEVSGRPAEEFWNLIITDATNMFNIITKWVTDSIVTPIVEFVDYILVGPQKIWDSIIGTTTDIKTTVDTWIKDNITTPITDIPKNLVSIVGKVLESLGLAKPTPESFATISKWVTGVADHIIKLPTEVVSVVVDIIKKLLSGSYNDEVVGWLKGVGTSVKNLPSYIINMGADIVDKLLTGDYGEIVKGWVDNLGKSIHDSFWATMDWFNPWSPNKTGGNTGSGGGSSSTGNSGGLATNLDQNKNGILDLDEQKTTNQDSPTPSVNKTSGGSGQFPQGNETPGAGKLEVIGRDANGKPILGPRGSGGSGQGNTSGGLTNVAGGSGGTYESHYGTGNAVDKSKVITPSNTGASKPAPKPTGPAKANEQGIITGSVDTAPASFAPMNPDGIYETNSAYQALKQTIGELSTKYDENQQLLSTQAGKQKLAEAGTWQQRDAMEQMKASLHTTNAATIEHAKQLGDATNREAIFRSGQVESQKALVNKAEALIKNTGLIEMNNQMLGTGIPQLIAYGEGQNEVSQRMYDAALNVEKTRGSINQYTTELAAGVPQTHAYNQALLDQQMSYLKLQESASGLVGTYQGIITGMNDANTVSALQQHAFAANAVSAAKWGESLLTARHEQDGFRTGLQEVADSLGVLPGQFTGTNEQFKEFISLSVGAGEAFDSFVQGVQSAASGVVSGLGDAIRKSNDEFNTQIESLEEEWGFKFSEALTNVFESSAGLDAIGKLSTDLMTGLEMLGPAINNPALFNEVKSGFIAQITETFDDIDADANPKAKQLMTNIINAINAPVNTGDPVAVQQYMAKIQTAINALGPAGSATAQTWTTAVGTINNANTTQAQTNVNALGTAIAGVTTTTGLYTNSNGQLVDALGQLVDPLTAATTGTGSLSSSMLSAKEASDKYAQSLASTKAAIAEYNEQTGGLWKNASPSTSGSIWETTKGTDLDKGDKEQPGSGNIGGSGSGSTGGGGDIDAALLKVQQYNALIAQVPAATTTAFTTAVQNAAGQINMLTEYIAVAFTTWVANIQPIDVIVTTAFTTGVQNAAGQLNLLTEYIAMAFTTWSANIMPIAVIMTSAFTTGVQNAAGMLNSLVGYTATAFTNIVAQPPRFAVAITQAFNTGVQNAAGQLNRLVTYAQTVFNAMGQLPARFAVAMTSSFNTATQNAAGQLTALGNHSNRVFSSMIGYINNVMVALSNVGTVAQAAAGEVQQLASELGNLPTEHHFTFYTHYETTGTPPAAFGTVGHYGRDLIVGETGRELVIPHTMYAAGGVLGKEEKPYVTKGIERIRGGADKAITVIPLQGHFKESFLKKYPQFEKLASMYAAEGLAGGQTITGDGTTEGNVNITGHDANDGDMYITNGKLTIKGKVLVDNSSINQFANAVNKFSNNVNNQSDTNTQSNTGTGGNINQTQTNTGSGTTGNISSSGVITTANGTIVDGNNARVTLPNGTVIDGKTGTIITGGGAGSGSGNTGGVGGGGAGSGGSSGSGNFIPGSGGQSYVPGAGKPVPGGGAGSGGTGNVPSGSPMGSGPAGGAGSNFNFEHNGKFYRVRQGVVTTNMTQQEINAAEAYYNYKFPSGTPASGTGGGQTGGGGGGTTTPPVGNVPGNGGIGGGNTGGGGTTTPPPAQTGPRAENLQALKYKDSDTYASITAPSGMTFNKATSGRATYRQTGANLHPEDWFIKKQGNGKFKVVDGQGRSVAEDFNSVNEAQYWVNYIIQEGEKNNPNRELGDTTLPLFRDKTTGKVYSQDANGNLYEQGGSFSDYDVDTETTAQPVRSGGSGGGSTGGGSPPVGNVPGGGGSGGTPTGSDNPRDYFDFNEQPSEGNVIGPTGYGHPDYIQTSGSSDRWKGQSWNPHNWRAVKMESDPNKWKVIDVNGKNIAANFRSERDAQEWIDDHRQMYNGGGDVGNGGSGGGGTGNVPGTGGGSTTTYEYAGSASDFSPSNPPPRGSVYRSATPNPENERQYVTLKNGSKMTVKEWNDQDDDTRDERMDDVKSIPSGWKMYEDGTIADPNYVPAEKAGWYKPVTTNTGGGGGSGGSGGGNTGNVPGQSGNNDTGYDFSNIQMSGGDKWTKSPQGPYEIVPMKDDPSKYKIIDSTGKNVAAGFDSVAHAEAYLRNYGYNLPGNQYYNGGGGSGGTGNVPGGSGGGSGGSGSGTTYSPDPDILTADPTPNTADKEWSGNIDRSDPESWKVVRMKEGAGAHQWKVVNDDGKNIAIRFKSEDEAQEYIDQHILAKERGSYTSPTAGGQTLHIAGPAGSGGGGSGSGGIGNGGSGSGGTGNVPGQSGNNTTGYTFENIQMSGGSKWTTSPQGPYDIVPMQDDPSKYKIIDSTGKNVAAGFDSEDHAKAYLTHYGYNLPGNQYYNGGGSSGGSGSGSGGSTGNVPNTGGGGSGGSTSPIGGGSGGGSTGNVPGGSTGGIGVNDVEFKDGSTMPVSQWNDLDDDERLRRVKDIKTIPAGAKIWEDGSISLNSNANPRPPTGYTGTNRGGGTQTGGGGTGNTGGGNTGGNTGGTGGSGSVGGGTGTGGTGNVPSGNTQTNTQTGGGNQISIQSNGKYYRYQSSTGVVETNMSEAEIAAWETKLGRTLPRGNTTPGTGGGGGAGGGNTGNIGSTPSRTDLFKIRPLQNPASSILTKVLTDMEQPTPGFDQIGTSFTPFVQKAVKEFGFNIPFIDPYASIPNVPGGPNSPNNPNNPNNPNLPNFPGFPWGGFDIAKIIKEIRELFDGIMSKTFNTQGMWVDASKIASKNVDKFL